MGLHTHGKIIGKTLEKLKADKRSLDKRKTIREKIRSSPKFKRAKKASKKVKRKLKKSLRSEVQALKDFRPRF